MDVEILIPLSFFALIAAIILAPIMMRERTKRSAHDLLNQAMQRGQVIDQDVIRSLTEGLNAPRTQARKSLGNGVILLALAGGFVAAFYLTGNGDSGVLIPAIIMGTLGGAFLLLAVVDYATKKRDAEA